MCTAATTGGGSGLDSATERVRAPTELLLQPLSHLWYCGLLPFALCTSRPSLPPASRGGTQQSAVEGMPGSIDGAPTWEKIGQTSHTPRHELPLDKEPADGASLS